jgi:uncharacterized membrane protein (DUF106 family)
LSFIDDIIAWVASAIQPYSAIPQSTLLTIGIALALGLTSSTAAKLLVDYNMVRNTMKEVSAWRKEMDQAKKANDEQTLSKLMKKSQAMMKAQSRASMEQMKVTAVTFVPFLLIWYLINHVLGGHIVAIAPYPLPIIGTQLTFFYWYFLSSFAVNFPIMRLFGIGMSEN